MGCNIHVTYEVRQADGSWAAIPWRDQYVTGQYDDGSAKLDYQAMFEDSLYLGRNYTLFAILAGVRNEDGPTRLHPISPPRGIPDDASLEARKSAEEMDCDGHSHSHLTLAEILSFDWAQGSVRDGIISGEEFRHFAATGKPRSWCKGRYGNVRVETPSKLHCYIRRGWNIPADVVTCVQWRETYAEAVGSHWQKTLDKLCEYGRPEDVRLVFFFDN